MKGFYFVILFPSLADRTHRSTIGSMIRQLSKSDSAMVALVGYRGEFVADGEEQAGAGTPTGTSLGPSSRSATATETAIGRILAIAGDRSGSDLSLGGGCIF